MWSRCLFIAASLLLTVVGTAAADNLLINPGFETGNIDPWEHWRFTQGEENPPPEEQWQVVDWDPHGGQYHVFGFGSNFVFRQQVIDHDLRWTDITEFSCWVRQDYPEEGDMRFVIDVQFDDPDDGLPGIGQMQFVDLSTADWTFYDGTTLIQNTGEFAEGILGDGARLYSVGIMGTFDTMTFADDWSLVPEPTSLLLFGLSGLGVLHRRRG